MAHIRRGRMNLSDAVTVNASKAKSVTLGFQSKKATTKATLKNVDQNPKVTGVAAKNGARQPGPKKAPLKYQTEVEPMDVCPPAESLTHLDILPAGVTNVDEHDSSDPQLCSENVRAIYIYLRHLERAQPIKEDFLRGGSVNSKMRAVLVNWLAEVHEQFKLLQETLYLCVAILDRYLSVEGLRVRRQKLQLIGVTSMFIAAKYEEMFSPEIGDFVYITDNSCSPTEIRGMEIDILKSLNFDLGRPLSLHFLRRYSKAGDVTADHHTFAKMALEASFVEYRVAHVLPSKMAAAALMLALRTIDETNDFSAIWTSNLAFYSGYDVSSLVPLCQELADILLSMETSKYLTIYKKYTHKSRMSLSTACYSKYRKTLELVKKGL